MGDDKILDLDALNEICGGSVSLIHRVLSQFVASAPALLTSVENAVANHDLGGIRTSAHTLKGASRTIGGVAVGDACQELESAVVGELGAGAYAQYLSVLQDRFDELILAVNEALSSNS